MTNATKNTIDSAPTMATIEKYYTVESLCYHDSNLCITLCSCIQSHSNRKMYFVAWLDRAGLLCTSTACYSKEQTVGVANYLREIKGFYNRDFPYLKSIDTTNPHAVTVDFYALYETYVLNLDTGKYIAQYSCSPRDAVIAAYAQFEKKDFNTWDYNDRYGSEVLQTARVIACGSYSAMLNPSSAQTEAMRRDFMMG